MKWVKQRASTVNRKREIEMAMERGREELEGSGGGEESEVLQGLYAESQTEVYRPRPIVDVSGLFTSISFTKPLMETRFLLLNCRAKYRKTILAI